MSDISVDRWKQLAGLKESATPEVYRMVLDQLVQVFSKAIEAGGTPQDLNLLARTALADALRNTDAREEHENKNELGEPKF